MATATATRFQLFSVCKRTNRVLSRIGTPDTLKRCENFKRAHDTYQPRAWFTVQESAAYNVGDTMPTT